MKEKIKRNKKIYIPIISVLMLLVLIGGSYALWSYTFLGNNSLIHLENIELEFLESSSEIIDITNAFPMSDREGRTQEETFDFQVRTSAENDIRIKYSLYIKKLAVDSGYNQLNDNQVKVHLSNFVGKQLVAPTLISNLDSYLLYEEFNDLGKTNPEEKDKYKLRVWIDDKVDASDWDEDTKLQYKFKIDLKSEALNVNACNQISVLSDGDTSGANAPVLSENMIPVYYDTCSETWKKADVSNKNGRYRWYDYDDKLWANSVTVKDSVKTEKLIESNKSVNITSVETITAYESQASTEAVNFSYFLLMTSTAGEASFDYAMTGTGEDDMFMIEVADINSDQTVWSNPNNAGTFSGTIPGDSLFMMVVMHQTSGGTGASISNISMPEGWLFADVTSLIELQSGESGEAMIPFERVNDGQSPTFNVKVLPMGGFSYTTDAETGQFHLNNYMEEEGMNDEVILNFLMSDSYSMIVGGYICPDFKSTSCSTLYQIKEADAAITKVDEYGFVEQTGLRNKYTDAEPGTEIDMDDILTMQVWVPRYKYTVWNFFDTQVNSDPQQIQIEFEKGTTNSGEISCIDTISGIDEAPSESCKVKTTNEACSSSVCNGKTYTHPAFTFGNKELKGMWVGKFEASSDEKCVAAENSAIGSGCNLKTIRPLVKPDVQSWRGAMIGTFENSMMAMNDTGNKYGFTSTDDTHAMKNMEWGASLYLSHSKYGTCTNGVCKKISLNNSSDFYTGRSAGNSTNSTSSEGTYKYNYMNDGPNASTTGNIYGIYDMSGGSYEYVMGNQVGPDGVTMMSGVGNTEEYPNYYSGYSGLIYLKDDSGNYSSITGTYNYPDEKYYDKYSYRDNGYMVAGSKLGDAVKEVAYNIAWEQGWYGGGDIMIYDAMPWFVRSGVYSNADTNANYGGFTISFSPGYANNTIGSRLVISQN